MARTRTYYVCTVAKREVVPQYRWRRTYKRITETKNCMIIDAPNRKTAKRIYQNKMKRKGKIIKKHDVTSSLVSP